MSSGYQNFLVKTLNLKKDDIPKFNLLFIHSFSVHFFISYQFVAVNSVFVETFEGVDFLPYAYIVAGITGYIVSLIYAEFQKRVSSKFVFLGTIAFMFLLTLLCRLGYGIIDEKILIFFNFIWAWPFISLVNIESGGLAIGLLNLRQVKRLFGLINIGGIISAIISYFAIPFILPFLSHTYDLLFISLIGLASAFVVIIVIYNRFTDQKSREINVRAQDNDLKFKDLFKERYFRMMFISASLSMVMIYFTDFGYLSSIKEQPELFGTNEAISAVIAIVAGVFKTGELIISYFSNRLLSRWGVKVGLSILPTFATIIILISTFIGFSFGTASIIFFLLMAINKSMERILRRGLDDPSFNILYQPLSGRIKLAVQAKVGVVMQMSIGIGGLILLGVAAVIKSAGGYQLKYFTLFFLPFLLVWVFVSRDLFKEYKKRLRQILADMSKDKKREGFRYNYGDELLKKNLKKHNEDVVRMSVTILSETNPSLIEPYATQLLEIDNASIKKAILSNIEPTWRKRITKTASVIAENDTSNEIKHLAQSVEEVFKFSAKTLTPEEITLLLESENLMDRLKLVTFLQKSRIENAPEILIKLLDDEKRIVKIAAIKLIARINNEELINKLINFLKSPEYGHVSGNCLLDIGDKVLPYIEKLFENNSPASLLVRVVEMLAKMGSSTAKSILVKHLNYPNRDVQIAVIRALYFCRYQANSRDSVVVKAKLEEVIDNILWIYATLNDIEAESNTLKLVQALDLERENLYEQIFELLSFLYDPKVINLIKKNIIGENTIFALEIIDNFINQDIKLLIIPLFDDISRNQRLKKLQNVFPQDKMNLVERLKDIIIRDYNKVEPHSIAKAAELLGKLHKNKRSDVKKKKDDTPQELGLWTKENLNALLQNIRKSEMPDEIFACLYHPEEIVYTTAAQIIYEENSTRCFNYLSQLTEEKKSLFPILKKEKEGEKELITKKVRFIKRLSLFFTTPENLLVKLAQISTIVELTKNDKLYVSPESRNDIYLIINGRLTAENTEAEELLFQPDDIIIRGLNTPTDLKEFTAIKKTVLMQCNRYAYFTILADETIILHHMFEMITSRS